MHKIFFTTCALQIPINLTGYPRSCFFFFFLLFSPRRSSVAAFKVCLHLRGYTNTVVAIPNSDDYEQLGVEGSHVRLVLPKHHLPDPVI